MKKALYIITVIISILFVSSCSETNDFSSTDNINVSNINNYNSFLNSVDSINNMYLSNVTTTRGKGFTNYVLDKKLDKIADSGGSIVGGWIGKNVGLTLGCTFGNPVTGALGYWGGRYVGRIVGGTAASFVANRYKDVVRNFFRSPRRISNNDLCRQEYVPSFIPESDSLNIADSLGYIHNQIMETLLSQEEKYINNGDINYELIYNDCVVLAKQYGIENDTITDNSDFKNETIVYAKEMAQLIYETSCDTTKLNTFYKDAAIKLEERNVPNETITLFKDYVTKVSLTCDNLSEEQQKKYANDLLNTIDKSELRPELKEEASSTTNILVNSSIYWNKQ